MLGSDHTGGQGVRVRLDWGQGCWGQIRLVVVVLGSDSTGGQGVRETLLGAGVFWSDSTGGRKMKGMLFLTLIPQL